LDALRDAVPAAGDVHVVGNGAAALALAVTALGGPGRTVVIARGEMIEIGDGLRLPELLEATGTRLRQVGTTTRATVHHCEAGILAPHPALPDEPDMTTMLATGADLVTSSGDKLLGGPQAGLLAGDAELVHRLRRHPLARALRVDKLTLAALEATLRGPTPP